MKKPSSITCPLAWVFTNPPSAPDVGVDSTVLFTETRVGGSVLDYKNKISKHQNATGDYNLVTGKVLNPGRYQSSSLIFGTEHTGTVTGGFASNGSTYNAPIDVVTRVSDIANAKIRSKINSDNGNFDAMVPLGELRELRGLIGGIADSGSGIVKALIALKTGRNSIHPAHVAALAGDMWLQWGFGVAPMISDARKAAEALASRSLRLRRIRYTGMHYEDFFLPVRQDSFPGVTGWDFDLNSVLQGRVQCRFTGGSLRGVNNSYDNVSLQDAFGFHNNRLPAVAWELMPYSWLFDYFSTAGAFLDTAFEAPNSDLFYISRSLFTKFKFITSATPRPSPVNYGDTVMRLDAKSENFVLEVVKFNRSSLGTLPARALRFKSFDEIATNSVNKVLNLASILASGYGRRVRINQL